MNETEGLKLALALVEQQLASDPNSLELLFRKGSFLEQSGQLKQAGEVYGKLLQRDAQHRNALNNLGNILLAAGDKVAARSLFERAVAAHPADPLSLVNLGNLTMKTTAIATARGLFERALATDPNCRAAHVGMSYVLEQMGKRELAAKHRGLAFQDRCVVAAPYRGSQPPITVLELVSTVGGNVCTQGYLSEKVFKRLLVAAEFYDPGTALPPHDLVFNSIGDVETTAGALTAAQALVVNTRAAVINHPAAVRATGRCDIAKRLAGVAHVHTARTVLLPREKLCSADAEATLAGEGFTFPLLLRSPGFHGGEHFVKVEDLSALETSLSSLPGDELFAIEYLDAASSDGKIRKYRVMMVDGALYPLHVAISENWKIHYFSADMTENASHRAEDAAFLSDMASVLGPRAMAALKRIQKMLGLDYGGIDFSLNADGEILLFEANATMSVFAPDEDERWDYRRPAVNAIYSAVRSMLVNKAGVGKEQQPLRDYNVVQDRRATCDVTQAL